MDALGRAFFLFVGLVALGLVLAACGGPGASGGDGVLVEPLRPTPAAGVSQGSPVATASPVSAGTPSAATNGATDGSALSGFSFPIFGACLPKGDQLMPNAARDYRSGRHEGVDFYGSDSCTRIWKGTEVIAVKAGRVLRADSSFVEMSAAELQKHLADPSTEEALDRFRGRQVWLQHDGGVVTRYAHLDAIAPGIVVGATVQRGQVIGYVGESGTPEAITNPGVEYHLHFEVRTGDSFLGRGLGPAEVRRLYTVFFSE